MNKNRIVNCGKTVNPIVFPFLKEDVAESLIFRRQVDGHDDFVNLTKRRASRINDGKSLTGDVRTGKKKDIYIKTGVDRE